MGSNSSTDRNLPYGIVGEAPSLSTPLEVVTQTPIAPIQAPFVPITPPPSIIHFQHVTRSHVVGNKIVSSFAIMLPCVSIVGKKTSTSLIMVNGFDTNQVFA